jgi:hypothetical protein
LLEQISTTGSKPPLRSRRQLESTAHPVGIEAKPDALAGEFSFSNTLRDLVAA